MKPYLNVGCGALLSLFAASTVLAADESLDSELQKYSYAMGYSIGNQVLNQFGSENIDLDPAAFARAIRDAMSQQDPALAPEEMQAVVMARREKQMAEMQEAADKAKATGEAFLKENGQRDGVVTTDSGLQYEILTEGAGDSPKATDTVVVHYRGTLLDGTEFDSSYRRENPATFALDGIIPGWKEVLQLMNVGAKWKVYIPSELAYGERGAGDTIGPNEALIFEIELLEVK
ncbi:MAG: peptidyl-prolyl cis-trans isomerase [marine bacterium B5-7]|nr:MAG: peptidyl-prolyl cis-trans isomerase [marine bacterium B5-7]